MSRAASLGRWNLWMGVACILALLPVLNCTARAETITMSMAVDGGPYVVIDAFATTSSGPPTYNITDISGLNTLLTGTAYQFISLGGSSTTFPGSSAGGTLSLTGEIITTGPATGQTVSIMETLSGFTSPTGPSGTLASSSTGNFNNAGPGNSHSASSMFNAISTPTYTVASTTTGPDHEGNGAFAPIPNGSFTTPYSLTNVITFSLSSAGADDTFGVTAKASAVPEPASVVTMLIGLPLPLVGLAWLRRRRTAIANS